MFTNKSDQSDIFCYYFQSQMVWTVFMYDAKMWAMKKSDLRGGGI